MADDIDSAAEREEAHRRASLATAISRARSGLGQPLSDGICHDCGDPIEPGRLKAVPTTTICAACAAETERAMRLGRAV